VRTCLYRVPIQRAHGGGGGKFDHKGGIIGKFGGVEKAVLLDDTRQAVKEYTIDDRSHLWLQDKVGRSGTVQQHGIGCIQRLSLVDHHPVTRCSDGQLILFDFKRRLDGRPDNAGLQLIGVIRQLHLAAIHQQPIHFVTRFRNEFKQDGLLIMEKDLTVR